MRRSFTRAKILSAAVAASALMTGRASGVDRYHPTGASAYSDWFETSWGSSASGPWDATAPNGPTDNAFIDDYRGTFRGSPLTSDVPIELDQLRSAHASFWFNSGLIVNDARFAVSSLSATGGGYSATFANLTVRNNLVVEGVSSSFLIQQNPTGRIAVGQDFILGGAGFGRLRGGGDVSVSRDLVLGAEAGGVGEYDDATNPYPPRTLTVGRNVIVGAATGARGTHYNFGDMSVGGDLHIGAVSGSDGAFSTGFGTVTVQGNMIIGTESGSGSATFTQSGGVHRVGGAVISDGDSVITYGGISESLEGTATSGASGGALAAPPPNYFIFGDGKDEYKKSGMINVTGRMKRDRHIIIGDGENRRSPTASITVNRATAVAGAAIFVGANGATGTFTQSGTFSNSASVSAAELYLGLALTQSGAVLATSGTYNLEGGTLSIAGIERIGFGGAATFSQTNVNSVHFCDELFINDSPLTTAVPVFKLQAGVLRSRQQFIGRQSRGDFEHTGGDNFLDLGFGGNGFMYIENKGQYTLTNGRVGSTRIYVGYSSDGTFKQDGGINAMLDYLSLGTLVSGSNRASGYYVLNGGDLRAPYEAIGNWGDGVFDQFGGTNSVGVDLYVAQNPGAKGSYTLSGGTLLVGEKTYVMPNGDFLQTAGYHNAGTLIGVYSGTNGTGNYELRNGSVITKDVVVNGAFTQAGGTAQLSGDLTIGQGPGHIGASPAYRVSAGTLEANNMILGQGATMAQVPPTFDQSGGNVTVAGRLTVDEDGNGGGWVQLRGGVLRTGQVIVRDAFDQTAGTHHTGTIEIANPNGALGATYLLSGGQLFADAITIGIRGKLDQPAGVNRTRRVLIQNGGIFDLGGLASGDELIVEPGGTFIPRGGSQWDYESTSGAGSINNGIGARMDMGGDVVTTISETSISNAGTVVLGGPSGVQLSNAAMIANSGTFLIQSDAGITAGDAGGGFENSGVLRKEQGTGASVIASAVKFTNPGGTIDVQSGEIRIDSAVTINPGSSLTKIGPGTLEFSGLLRVNGAGTHSAGNLGVRELLGNGSTTVAGGTLTANRVRQDLLAVNETGQVAIRPSGAGNQDGPPDLPWSTSNVKSLSMSRDAANKPTGKIDLANAHFIVDFAAGSPSPRDGIREMIASAHNGGDWLGTGLGSSKAAGRWNTSVGMLDNSAYHTPVSSFGGEAVDTSSALVRYTLTGDHNLDAVVDFADLVALNQNYNQSGRQWYEGDFTYDGLVNFQDMVPLNQNYGQTLTATGTEGGGGGAMMADPGGGGESLLAGGSTDDADVARFVLDMSVISELRVKITDAEPAHLSEFEAFVNRWTDLGLGLSVASSEESLGAASIAGLPEPGAIALIAVVGAHALSRRRRQTASLPKLACTPRQRQS